MTDRHAFLRVIKDNPADDTPRLVYADWLEEHGESERAQIIRTAVQLEIDMGVDLPISTRIGFACYSRRGIVSQLECSWRFWKEEGDLIWERELPWRVRLTTAPHFGADIAPVGRTSRQRIWRVAGRDLRLPRRRYDPAIILAARWPGIEFEFAFDTHRMTDGTTREQLA